MVIIYGFSSTSNNSARKIDKIVAKFTVKMSPKIEGDTNYKAIIK